jgi:hypothetical protein
MWLMIASVHTNGAGGIFLSPETADIHPTSHRELWLVRRPVHSGGLVPGTGFKEFKSNRRRTWLSVKT